MTKKLTLTIEQDVIKTAKQYAKKTGRSLSGLIENYLKVLVRKDSGKEEFSPKVRSLIGSVKLPKGFDYKKNLAKEINRKYSR